MRTTLRELWSLGKNPAKELAPHVEDAWAEDLVLELRLQGVSGPAIGEAISEVESHCVESGESAQDAFGDPTGYARSLGLSVGLDQTSERLAAAAAPTVVQLVGMLVTVWAFISWADGSALIITLGQVLSVLLLSGSLVGFVFFSEQALRLVIARPVVAFLAIMGISGLGAVLPALARHELGSVAALPVVVAAAAVLVAGAAWDRARPASGSDVDLITGPLDPPRAPDDIRSSVRLTGILSTLTALSMPVITFIALGLTWWLAQQ